MMKSKKFLLIILAFVVIAQVIITMPASAVSETKDLPNAYWGIQQEMNTARANNNHKGIIAAAQDAYNLFVGSANPDITADKWLKNKDVELGILTTYLLWAGQSAEELKDYETMKKWYSLYITFVNRQKTLWSATERLDVETFSIPAVESKILAYTVAPVFFTELPVNELTSVYTGAKYEPKNGLYYGSSNPYPNANSAGNTITASNTKTPSGAIFYVMFKEEKIEDFDWILKELVTKTDILELAWNLNPRYISLKDAVKEIKLIEDTADYLAKLGTPVLLRVAAEMNVWNPPANADDFKNFFRAVADIMRKKAPNVAMLFSPNEGSAFGVSIMDYYPGDEYVDWVGISHYYQYYFLGQKNAPSIDRAKYMTAEFANPVHKVENIINLFGGKKPIMLSEYGIANYSNTLKESTVDWAKYRLQQLQAYLPMFYPEIKAMFYFDIERPAEHNNYAIKNSPVINELYNKLMRENGIYIPKGKDAPDFTYAKLDSKGWTVSANKVVINTYVEVMHNTDLTVTYTINGKEYAKSAEIPYKGVLNLSGLANGAHNITVTVKTPDNTTHATKNITAVKSGNSVILSDNSLKALSNRSVQTVTPKVGDVLGNVLYSNVSAQINGHAIPTSVIAGKTLIVVEDLANYGFDVVWNNSDKSLKITRNKSKEFKPLPVEKNTHPAGTTKEKYFFTDIKAYLSGEVAESYAVSGKTLIDFDSLSRYGTSGWNSKTMIVSLWLD